MYLPSDAALVVTAPQRISESAVVLAAVPARHTKQSLRKRQAHPGGGTSTVLMGFLQWAIIFRGSLQNLGQPPQSIGGVGQGPQGLS